jgi:hypothetical protein
MPALKNPRHERFAQAVARAVDAAAAYQSAGYDAEGGAAEAGASRLLRNAAVAARIAELQATPATAVAATEVMPTEVTTAQAVREFEEARLLALQKGQAAAAVSATMAKVKLAGLLAERPENKPASPTKFDGNYTEAARRIAFLLRLAAKETSSGQKR